MASSSEIWVLNKIVDLAVKCDISPLSVETYLTYNDGGGPLKPSSYRLAGVDNGYSNDTEKRKIEKFWKLLGLDDFLERKFGTLEDVNQAVDHALSLTRTGRPR